MPEWVGTVGLREPLGTEMEKLRANRGGGDRRVAWPA